MTKKAGHCGNICVIRNVTLADISRIHFFSSDVSICTPSNFFPQVVNVLPGVSQFLSQLKIGSGELSVVPLSV